MNNLSHLLDTKDLKRQPLELRKICENLFYKGKGLRSQLVSLVGSHLQLSKKKILILSRIIEYIHNSSLLHDDFIDHSKVRRNHKTAWLEFSPSQAVLTGDYLLAKVNILLVREKNLKLLKATAQAICQLAEGEFLQRELFPFKNKDLKKRDKVSELKTASLFKWCLQAPFLFKKREETKLYHLLDSIGFRMGLLFQRSDDLIDFSVRNKDKKPFLSDLKQQYYNSFSCFLLQKASSQKEKQFQKIKKLSHVYKLFPDFKNKVADFDKINVKIINQTRKDIIKLQPFLKKREQGLIRSLEELPAFLYWRK